MGSGFSCGSQESQTPVHADPGSWGAVHRWPVLSQSVVPSEKDTELWVRFGGLLGLAEAG